MKTEQARPTSKLFLSFALVISLAFLHCASTRKLPTLAEQSDCHTSIEGYYEHPHAWNGKKPALIIRKNSELRVLSGKVISQTANGVTFDPNREGAFYDPQTEFFPFNKIETFIDETGRVVAGKIPAKLTTELALILQLKHGFREVGRRERLGKMEHGAMQGQWRDVILLESRSAMVG